MGFAREEAGGTEDAVEMEACSIGGCLARSTRFCPRHWRLPQHLLFTDSSQSGNNNNFCTTRHDDGASFATLPLYHARPVSQAVKRW